MRIGLFLIIFCVGWIAAAQSDFALEKTGESSFDSDRLVKIDNFGTIYHIKGQEFIKSSRGTDINFSNIQLGEISTADAFNPLKINIYYEVFNTVIILDNRLAEIAIIKFNEISPFRLSTLVSTGYDNSIWIYNQNTQQLELYDYIADRTRVNTLPLEGNALDLCSNFNYSYFLTDQALYTFNYFGNLVSKVSNPGFTEIAESNGMLIGKQGNDLQVLNKNTGTFQSLELPELLIKQFFLTDETLYIYDGENLHQFQLKGN